MGCYRSKFPIFDFWFEEDGNEIKPQLSSIIIMKSNEKKDEKIIEDQMDSLYSISHSIIILESISNYKNSYDIGKEGRLVSLYKDKKV